MKIKIGTSLTLEPTFTERVERYHCKVIDTDENFLYIDYPVNTKTNRTIFLTDGTQLRVSFTEEANAFAFKSEVLGKQKGHIPMVRLAYPGDSEIIKIQRRDFVRVSTPLDISIQFGEDKYQFVTDDISAGGAAVILNSNVNFAPGDEVFLLIPLAFNNGDIKYITTTASVVRIWDRGQQKLASIQFINTDEIDKQQIVRFCFERQLLVRKKEMN